MSDPRSITREAFEILVTRELRKAGLEPIGFRRRANVEVATSVTGYAFDVSGRLEAYDQRWTALIECRNSANAVQPTDVDALRQRADEAGASSAFLFSVSTFDVAAVIRGDQLRVALIRVVDAHSAYVGTGVIDADQLPAWLPEFTAELVSCDDGAEVHARLIAAGEPELILERLRPAE
jgi:hypothetical protein